MADCWRETRTLPACPALGRLRALNLALAERVHGQHELLARRAEREPDVILDVPLVLQQQSFDCGTAAAASVLRYHQRKLPNLAQLGWPSPIDGTDPRILEAMLRAAGLGAVAGEMDLEDLKYHTRRGRPVLCLVQHNNCGHYVTVRGVAYKKVHYNCPASGEASLLASKFDSLWVDVCRDGTRYTRWSIVGVP